MGSAVLPLRRGLRPAPRPLPRRLADRHPSAGGRHPESAKKAGHHAGHGACTVSRHVTDHEPQCSSSRSAVTAEVPRCRPRGARSDLGGDPRRWVGSTGAVRRGDDGSEEEGSRGRTSMRPNGSVDLRPRWRKGVSADGELKSAPPGARRIRDPIRPDGTRRTGSPAGQPFPSPPGPGSTLPRTPRRERRVPRLGDEHAEHIAGRALRLIVQATENGSGPPTREGPSAVRRARTRSATAILRGPRDASVPKDVNEYRTRTRTGAWSRRGCRCGRAAGTTGAADGRSGGRRCGSRGRVASPG